MPVNLSVTPAQEEVVAAAAVACALVPATMALTGRYYAFNLGPIHVQAMDSYDDFSAASKQFAFLKRDFECIDRAATPLVVVVVHTTPYHSSAVHVYDVQSDVDPAPALRAQMEALWVQNKVDVVMGGHVHNVEATTSMYCRRGSYFGPRSVRSFRSEAGNTPTLRSAR